MKRPKIVHNWDDLPVALSVNDAATILDISTGYVGVKCRDGTLPAVQIGRNWYINRDQLREMLGQAPAAQVLPPDAYIEAIAQRTAELLYQKMNGGVSA